MQQRTTPSISSNQTFPMPSCKSLNLGRTPFPGTTNIIRYVAGLSASQYADELRDAAKDLKYEIMAKMDRDNFMEWALPGNPEPYQLRNELEPVLDKLIERKLEDFRLGFIEGKDMNATTHNTVNIIKSNISHAVVQITQSGKDAISRDDQHHSLRCWLVGFAVCR